MTPERNTDSPSDFGESGNYDNYVDTESQVGNLDHRVIAHTFFQE